MKADRFWANVDRSGSCWTWLASKDVQGYGKLNDGRRRPFAHRFSWELANGPIPDGLCVLHRCDVPACVRLDHLFLGTHADNARDMLWKGRSRKGEKHGSSKLTDADVVAIRYAYLISGCRQSDLARAVGVSRVSDWVRGRRRYYDALSREVES